MYHQTLFQHYWLYFQNKLVCVVCLHRHHSRSNLLIHHMHPEIVCNCPALPLLSFQLSSLFSIQQPKKSFLKSNSDHMPPCSKAPLASCWTVSMATEPCTIWSHLLPDFTSSALRLLTIVQALLTYMDPISPMPQGPCPCCAPWGGPPPSRTGPCSSVLKATQSEVGLPHLVLIFHPLPS